MNKELKAAIEQASRYGTQVAQLEDAGMHAERVDVRLAYRNFLRQFDGIERELVCDGYWDAYCTA